MPTLDSAPDITVLSMDEAFRHSVLKSGSVRILNAPDPVAAASASNVIVVATEGQVQTVAPFVRAAHRRRQLRAFLIRQEEKGTWLPQILTATKLKMPRHTQAYTGEAVPGRILEAWLAGAQNRLIADAAVRGDTLWVASCALEILLIPFAVKPLDAIAPEQRAEFTIDRDGGSICWPEADIELDLEGLRRLIDPVRRERAKHEQLAHDARFGRAVAALRREAGLRQADIAGLSERHVRRIEAGEGFSAEAVAHLAKAHGLSVNEYMTKIAGRMTDEKTAGNRRRRVRKSRA